MRSYRAVSTVVLVLALALALWACSKSSPKPSPTAASAATATQTKAPTAPATAAPASPTSASAKSTASPGATGGPSPADLAAKARTATEYSFDMKLTSPGQAASGKMYVKQTKVRVEASVSGQNTVIIVDTATKVAYMMVSGQNAAVKVDYGQVAAQVPNPTEQISALPADSKFVGNDTIDGKTAAVYEVTNAQGTTRYSIWTDRGLPLRMETTTPQGKGTMEYSNYQFGPQANSLFELPPGMQVMDVGSSIPGMPGGTPAPKP